MMDLSKIINCFPERNSPSQQQVLGLANIIQDQSIKPGQKKKALQGIVAELVGQNKSAQGKVVNQLLKLAKEKRRQVAEDLSMRELDFGAGFKLPIPQPKAGNQRFLNKVRKHEKQTPYLKQILSLDGFMRDDFVDVVSKHMHEFENSPTLDPKSKEYRPENLFYAKFFIPFMQMQRAYREEDGVVVVDKESSLKYLNFVRSLVGEDENLDAAIKRFEAYEHALIDLDTFAKLIQVAENDAIEKHLGIFMCQSPQGGTFMGAKLAEMSSQENYAGYDIDVHQVLSLNGVALGQGYFRGKSVYLPFDTLLREEPDYHRNQAIFQGLNKLDRSLPNFQSTPNLVAAVVGAYESQSFSEAEIESTYREHVLSEELAHAASNMFYKDLHPEAGLANHFRFVVNDILRPDSPLKAEFEAASKVNQQMAEAYGEGIFETEGTLKSIENSPLVFSSLLEAVGSVLLPVNKELLNSRSGYYDVSSISLFKFFSEKLFPEKLDLIESVDWDSLIKQSMNTNGSIFSNEDSVDSNAALKKLKNSWFEFFDCHLKDIDSFNRLIDSKLIQNTAKEIHAEQFLTYLERQELVKAAKA
jgi:hypothetical protein